VLLTSCVAQSLDIPADNLPMTRSEDASEVGELTETFVIGSGGEVEAPLENVNS
jgi:hypothetical protein